MKLSKEMVLCNGLKKKKKTGKKRFFDDLTYKNRFIAERYFTWLLDRL